MGCRPMTSNERSDLYEERYYRKYVAPQGVKNFNVTLFESDLQIYTDGDIEDELTETLRDIRKILEAYIEKYPDFNDSLVPIKPLSSDHKIIRHMKDASKKLGVGPMATVAGAVAHYLGQAYYKQTSELIIENGGDLYVYSTSDKKILLHGGKDAKVKNLTIELEKDLLPIGVCTSSGKLGHSLSFGQSDAITVISKDTLVADAAATAFGNLLKGKGQIADVLNYSKTVKGLDGVVAIVDDQMGAWGNFKFV